jgi:hypothetical protein
MSHLKKRRRLVTKEERNKVMEMTKRLREAWDGPVEVLRDRWAA